MPIYATYRRSGFSTPPGDALLGVQGSCKVFEVLVGSETQAVPNSGFSPFFFLSCHLSAAEDDVL